MGRKGSCFPALGKKEENHLTVWWKKDSCCDPDILQSCLHLPSLSLVEMVIKRSLICLACVLFN